MDSKYPTYTKCVFTTKSRWHNNNIDNDHIYMLCHDLGSIESTRPRCETIKSNTFLELFSHTGGLRKWLKFHLCILFVSLRLALNTLVLSFMGWKLNVISHKNLGGHEKRYKNLNLRLLISEYL